MKHEYHNHFIRFQLYRGFGYPVSSLAQNNGHGSCLPFFPERMVHEGPAQPPEQDPGKPEFPGGPGDVRPDNCSYLFVCRGFGAILAASGSSNFRILVFDVFHLRAGIRAQSLLHLVRGVGDKFLNNVFGGLVFHLKPSFGCRGGINFRRHCGDPTFPQSVYCFF